MKILYVITQADGGGAQKYVLALAKYFKGFIAAGTEDQKLFQQAAQNNLPYFQLRHLKRNIHPYHDLACLFELRKLYKHLKPDIVHLNSSKAGFLGSLAGVGLKPKIIFTAHGFIFNEPFGPLKKGFYLLLEKLASHWRDFIITVSDADRISAHNHKLINPAKIRTIHNGIPEINFIPRGQAGEALSQKKETVDGKFIFGTIANFYYTKGLDILVEAVAKINPQLLKKTKFVLIGYGSMLEPIQSKIKDLGLEENFVLTGQVPEAEKLLLGFDAFVLPSRKEGFPFVLLYALQAGLPIVATDAGGNKEAVGEAGIIVQKNNPNALASGLSKILTAGNDDLQEWKTKALQRAKLFTEQKMFEETEQVYKKVLS